jgi:uncharacterized membrane protein YoaK (UPF0700 family)
MPLLFLLPLIGLGGAFVGAQVDNAVQSAAAAPQVVDESKMPWYVSLAIWAVVGYIAFKILKKAVK